MAELQGRTPHYSIFFLFFMIGMSFFPTTKAMSIAMEKCIAATRCINQSLMPPSCVEMGHCPEYFVGGKSWDTLTARCCPFNDQLTFHAQRSVGDINKCLRVCLPKTQCQAGYIPVLYEIVEDGTRYAFSVCETCENGTFQPESEWSYNKLEPTCPKHHNRCHAKLGFALAKRGNASEDNLCRCLWEEGFAPMPQTPQCQAGFKAEVDRCHCEKSPCVKLEGMRLNSDYKCVPKTQTTAPKVPASSEEKSSSESSEENKDHGGSETETAKPAKPTVSREGIMEPSESVTNKNDSLWYLPVIAIIAGVLLLVGSKCYRRCGPRAIKRFSGITGTC